MKNIVIYMVKVYIMSFIANTYAAQMLPEDFVYLKDLTPAISQDIRYATSNNFIGKPLAGYESAVCIVTLPTAQALLKVQQELNQQGLGLKVFDGYRPQRTVDAFISWSKDSRNQTMKAEYYPNVDKADFFKLGYVAAKSGHTRGSTVDVTIIDLKTNKEFDMGTIFDFMDELSHPFNRNVTAKQFANRQFLNYIMSKHGFIPWNQQDTEWWHFTLKNELFPNTYFNFPVKEWG